MNREIKFRGQSINGNWAFGLIAKDGECVFISNSAGKPFAFEVRPETISQFTGLLDKNEKEIYEGDIVECRESFGVFSTTTIYHIVYGNGGFFSKEKNSLHNIFLGNKNLSVSIIGNIHENPELLK